MIEISQCLQIDPQSVCQEVEDLIRTAVKDLRRDGAVVAVSGGLDSAVTATLTVRSLGAERVHLLNLPERDSNPVHQDHARRLTQHLGTPLIVEPITPILRAAHTYRLLPLGLVPGRRVRAMIAQRARADVLASSDETLLVNRFQPEAGSWLAKGTAYATTKHRTRMVVLYQYAGVRNLMVVGAANRTEWLTGTFSQWGVDHCADVMPVVHLYRSQVEQIAEYLQIPEVIRLKPSDPDVMPGIDNKDELLGGAAIADQILCGIEMNLDRDELCRAYGMEKVEHVLTLWELSRHMRETPYTLMTNGHAAQAVTITDPDNGRLRG